MQAHTTMRQSERRIGKFNATRRFVLCFFLCFFPLLPFPLLPFHRGHPSFLPQRNTGERTKQPRRSSAFGRAYTCAASYVYVWRGAGLCCVYCTCVSGTGRLECKRSEVKPFEVYLPRYSSVNFNSLSQSVPGSRSRSGPFPLSLSLFSFYFPL